MGKKKRNSVGVAKPSAGGKKKAWGAKNVLHSPFSLVFPPALAGSADAVIDILKKAFPEPPMFRHSAPKPPKEKFDDANCSSSSNDSEIEGKQDEMEVVEKPAVDGVDGRIVPREAADGGNGKSSPSSKRPVGMLVGMNEVTRGLEKGKVALVVAARDSSPPILTAHLPALCYMQDAALVSASGNGDDIATALGVKKLLAFAILRPEKVEECTLKQRTQTLIDSLQPHATALNFPWLAVAKGGRDAPPQLPEPHLAPPSKLL